MPKVHVVDENDISIGGATKQELWDKGLFHRVVWIMLLDEKGRLFMQHRAPTKQPFPAHWDSSVGGHVDEGEDYEEAAHREIYEETGIKDISLEEVDYYKAEMVVDGRKLNRFCKIFTGTVSSSQAIQLDPTEADAGKWYTHEEARRLFKEPGAKLTPGLRVILEKHYGAAGKYT